MILWSRFSRFSGGVHFYRLFCRWFCIDFQLNSHSRPTDWTHFHDALVCGNNHLGFHTITTQQGALSILSGLIGRTTYYDTAKIRYVVAFSPRLCRYTPKKRPPARTSDTHPQKPENRSVRSVRQIVRSNRTRARTQIISRISLHQGLHARLSPETNPPTDCINMIACTRATERTTCGLFEGQVTATKQKNKWSVHSTSTHNPKYRSARAKNTRA